MYNDLISFSIPDICFTWINLLLIFFIVKKLLFKPIKNMMAKREEEISNIYSKAEAAKENAQKLEEESNQILKKAKLEAVEIVKKATELSQTKAEAIIERAKIKAMELLEKSQSQIKKERDEALRKAFNEVSDVVLIAASKLIEQEMTPDNHKKVIEKILSEVKVET